jgi:putative ABC transport system ATP-binding protein
MSIAPSLRSRGISKAFTTGKVRLQVIKDSSIDILPGELTLVVGPSGSGKSTMLSMMSGLLRPDTGHVFALDTDLWTLDEAALDRFRLLHCGFVFQGFNLFTSLTALQNIIVPLQYLGVHGREAMDRAQGALEEVGLRTRGHLRPGELSGGEKQRVAIARAILKNPRILIFDEATSALDSKSEKAIQEELERIARGHTTLVIAHRLSTVMDADQILVMDHGRIIERGTHRELLEREGAYAQMWALQQEEIEQQ